MPSKNKFDNETVIKAIVAAKGFVTQAATNLGCSRMTVWNYIKNNPDIKEAMEDAKEAILDFTEAQLIKSIKEGNLTAIIFMLKTQGYKRGYGQVIDENISQENNRYVFNYIESGNSSGN